MGRNAIDEHKPNSKEVDPWGHNRSGLMGVVGDTANALGDQVEPPKKMNFCAGKGALIRCFNLLEKDSFKRNFLF